MNFLIVYNRKAGQVKHIKLEEISSYLKEHRHQVKTLALQDLSASTELAAWSDNYPNLICLGGDGTLNTVINHLASKNWQDICLIPYPSGTANDFAYQLYGEALDLAKLVKAAENQQYSYLDIGWVNGQYFINVLAAGSFAEVAYSTSTKWKQKIGMWAYWLEALRRLPEFHSFNFQMWRNEKLDSMQGYVLLVLNGKGAGGFKKLVPASSLCDGKLDVLVIKESRTLLELAALFPKILSGEHLEDHRIEYFQQAGLNINTDNPEISSVVDGERGPDFPLEITVLPQKVAFVT